jgi:hypothetical protein
MQELAGPARIHEMGKNAFVSDELAKKFATEKETPYTRWVKAEGLDIISSLYVPNLHTVELKPWPRRGGRAPPTTATFARSRLGSNSARSGSCSKKRS